MPASSADIAIRVPPIPAIRSLSLAVLGDSGIAVRTQSVKSVVKYRTLKDFNNTISLFFKKHLQGQPPSPARYRYESRSHPSPELIVKKFHTHHLRENIL